MRVAGIAGPSGAGKTTLIVELIKRYTAGGARVGAIKHTHHPLNTEHRGDTGRFLDAGAETVILAGADTAVIFTRRGTAHATYGDARELLARLDTDVVLIEGFKHADAWPKVTITGHVHPTAEAVMAELDVMWRSQ